MRWAVHLLLILLLCTNVETDAQMLAPPVWQYRKLITLEFLVPGTAQWTVPKGVTRLESIEA